MHNVAGAPATGEGMQVITTTRGAKDLPRWFAASFEVLKGLGEGRIEIGLPDGRVFAVDGAAPGPTVRLDVINPDLFARVARDGEIGFCEAYMDGWWDTPDLQAFLDVLLTSRNWTNRMHPLAAAARSYERLLHWMRRNSPAQAKKNIAHHYDLGNGFYSRWLDETMTYSSAMFASEAEALEDAQTRKYASICDKIGARPDGHILEIGCGWGGFAEYAATERGARVTGLTISREQHEFARRRVFEAGLAERVDIVMRDYREERGQYDGVASIEMFEAVGEKYWPVYFETVRDRLRPDARATIQVITVEEGLWPTYRKTLDFIQKYIFPGGMLPSPSVLGAHIERAGLRSLGSVTFGESYSQTLRRWHLAFNDAWDDIQGLGFDERFRRMWTLYLTSCAAAFRTGATDVAQVSMQRPA